MVSTLFVGFEEDCLEEAKMLARHLHLTLSNEAYPRLVVQRDGLLLLNAKRASPLRVDFHSKAILARVADKGQGLLRACQPEKYSQIMDATAGWGRDAALLAHHGAKVLMLERQPFMAALLADGLKRAAHLPLSLLCIDTTTYLKSLPKAHYPEVIYIDPMHPVRQKSALVKNDMQALQALIKPDEDVAHLLEESLHVATQRVVVKWPQHLKPLEVPHHSFNGKTVRFDVYVTSFR